LPNFPNLTHLELHAKGQTDLADGQRWKMLTSCFIVFNFKINIELVEVEQYFDSFRTPFWLQEKRWYVAYDKKCLFSVPRFAPTHVTVPYDPPTHSTAPDNMIFYDAISKLTFQALPIRNRHRFIHIETLEFEFPISLETLLTIVDLRQVQHLALTWLNNIPSFIFDSCVMPRLRKLSIDGVLTPDLIEHIDDGG
jgi:hypothetical protein